MGIKEEIFWLKAKQLINVLPKNAPWGTATLEDGTVWEREFFHLQEITTYDAPSTGLVKAGDRVRICAVPGMFERVVTIEIKDFHGDPKDHNKPTKSNWWMHGE